MSTKSARDCGLRRTLLGEVFSILAIGRDGATGDWGMDKFEFFSTWRSSRLNSFSSLGTKIRSGIGSLLPLPFCWNRKQTINNSGNLSLYFLNTYIFFYRPAFQCGGQRSDPSNELLLTTRTFAVHISQIFYYPFRCKPVQCLKRRKAKSDWGLWSNFDVVNPVVLQKVSSV